MEAGAVTTPRLSSMILLALLRRPIRSYSLFRYRHNAAERDLRMSKVKQKVSGCFRTRKYAEAYCRISSYLQSMANQGYNPLVAIQIALAGRAVDNLPE